jgi:hypothetical protein
MQLRWRAVRGRPADQHRAAGVGAHPLAGDHLPADPVHRRDGPDGHHRRFIVTWVAAILIWRYGHIEEKWTARLQGAGGKEAPLSPPWAEAEASD